ncbi:MAG: NADH-quinone oxidoreductase subunit D, partial [Bdellovibrionota bacterium]
MGGTLNTARPENLNTDPIELELGPFHWSVNGPLKFILRMDGETIIRAAVEAGYVHRGIEKICENRPWNSLCVLADRVDAEAAVFYEHALCMAIEEIGEIMVPKRAQAIRVMLSELSRVSSHMAYIVRIARAVGAEAIVHYILRDREKILDLFELLSGARFTVNFLRIGGVAADVSEGFIERTVEVCELIRSRLKEYNDLFSYNQAFLDRAAFLGVITESLAVRSGMTGPNARASGLSF